MNKKLSKKDLKDWKKFVEGNEAVENKDSLNDNLNFTKESTIDLHGFTLDQANTKVEKFINDCFHKKVKKLNIITGKGLRSKVDKNPYQSKDLGILKYSIPEFIKNDKNLMNLIKEIKEAKIEDGGSGAFYVYLKK